MTVPSGADSRRPDARRSDRRDPSMDPMTTRLRATGANEESWGHVETTHEESDLA